MVVEIISQLLHPLLQPFISQMLEGNCKSEGESTLDVSLLFTDAPRKETSKGGGSVLMVLLGGASTRLRRCLFWCRSRERESEAVNGRDLTSLNLRPPPTAQTSHPRLMISVSLPLDAPLLCYWEFGAIRRNNVMTAKMSLRIIMKMSFPRDSTVTQLWGMWGCITTAVLMWWGGS